MVFFSLLCLFIRKAERDISHVLVHSPESLPIWGWGQTEARSLKFHPGLLYACQEPKSVSHHCLPRFSLGRDWSQELELGLELRPSDVGIFMARLTGCLLPVCFFSGDVCSCAENVYVFLCSQTIFCPFAEQFGSWIILTFVSSGRYWLFFFPAIFESYSRN